MNNTPGWTSAGKQHAGLHRVWVVQNQHRWDRDARVFVPKYDIEPAREFGVLFDLLSPTASPFRPGPIVAELHKKLHDFDDTDMILCLGNPLLIGWSMAIAAHYNNGRVRALQWSGKDQRYMDVEVVDLFTPIY